MGKNSAALYVAMIWKVPPLPFHISVTEIRVNPYLAMDILPDGLIGVYAHDTTTATAYKGWLHKSSLNSFNLHSYGVNI